MTFVQAHNTAFIPSNILGGWRGAGLLSFNPKKILYHIEILPPAIEPINTPPSSTLWTDNNLNLDPTLFNSFLLTSSPLNDEEFRKTASALWAEVQQKKVLATPIHQLIPRLTIITERLHVENIILKTRLQAAMNILSARKERKKGARVYLKDLLCLTTDEAIAAAQQAKEEKKKRTKKGGKRGKKRKVQEIESESEDNSSQVDSDSILLLEILKCIMI